MRIAVVGAHSYIEELPSFAKVGTGTGLTLVVWQTCKNLVSSGDEVDLVTLQRKPQAMIKGVNVHPFGAWRVLRNIDFRSIYDCKELFLGLPVRMQLRRMKFDVTTGSIQKTLRQTKPDVVCINGTGWSTLPFVLAAVKERIPFFIVMHGLNYLDQNLKKIMPRDRVFEKNFIKFLNDHGISIGCVSSGIKSEAIQSFGLAHSGLVQLVLNSYEYDLSSLNPVPEEVLRIKDALRGRKVVMTVSSLTTLKNQMELVDAIASMPRKDRDALCYIMAGDGVEQEAYARHIRELGLQDTVFMVGRISRDNLPHYYDLADCVALISIREGFGVSAIEAFFFGKPVLAYDDLSAINDIYSPDAMVLVKKRGVQTLADGVRCVMQRKWEPYKIRQWSKLFNHKQNAKQYHELAQLTLEQGIRIDHTRLRSFLLNKSCISDT